MGDRSHSRTDRGEATLVKSAGPALGSLLLLLVVSLASVSQVMGEQPVKVAAGQEEDPATKDEGSSGQQQPAAKGDWCEERDAKVVRTGKFDGAKLRATPGFKHPQAGIVTRGAHLVVCESTTTPGTKIPNVWYRIHEGKHEGLWIHRQLLDF